MLRYQTFNLPDKDKRKSSFGRISIELFKIDPNFTTRAAMKKKDHGK